MDLNAQVGVGDVTPRPIRPISRSNRASDLLADLLVALRGDQHLHAGLVHVVDVGPVSLGLGVLDATGQAVDGPRRPAETTAAVEVGGKPYRVAPN